MVYIANFILLLNTIIYKFISAFVRVTFDWMLHHPDILVFRIKVVPDECVGFTHKLTSRRLPLATTLATTIHTSRIG